jgi:hypothetical protein
MLELAILTPMLIILFFGFVEFGRALLQINTLTKAVTAGARYVARVPDAINPADCSQGTGWAAAIVQGELLIENDNAGLGDAILPGLDANGAITFSNSTETVTYGGSNSIDVCVITVQASAPFAAISGDSPVPFLQIGPITIRAQAEERYIAE